MPKKLIIAIITSLIMVTIIIINVTSNKLSTKEINQNNGSISVMVYDESEGEYVEQLSVPIGSYALNLTYSTCEGKGTIKSYDNVLGKVTALIKGTDKCTFYFDYVTPVNETFSYTSNSYQTFTIPHSGNYSIEAWGANGYNATNQYGAGAYTYGEIYLQAGTVLYLYLGGQGSNVPASTNSTTGGGYNGGGNGTNTGYNPGAGASGGGGATDIRIFTSTPSSSDLEWNSALGLKSRIMVAAGGGGKKDQNAGSGGGLTGYTGSEYSAGTGGTQTAGGSGYAGRYGTSSNGGFGYGGAASSYASGGGSGWYGSGGGARDTTDGSGGGGSSYISGFAGCIGVDSSGNAKCTAGSISVDCSKSWTNYYFTNGKMIDGRGYVWNSSQATEIEAMPSPVSGYYSTSRGHLDKGYIRIKSLSFSSTEQENGTTLSTYIINNNPAGYRGSSHSDSATQNMYRFTGSYQSSDSSYAGSVDNYICLGSDASSCPADNMYRILGVVAENDSTTGLEAGMVKVIKNTPIGYYKWDDGQSADDTSGNVNSSSVGTTYTCSSASYNFGSSCFPDWPESNLNINRLNGTYLNNLSFSNKIASVKWHCYSSETTPTAANEYSSTICSNTTSKVSLMYAGDYLNSYNNGTTVASSSYKGWLHLCDDNTNYGSGYNSINHCSQWTMANFGMGVDSQSYWWRAYIVNSYGTILGSNNSNVSETYYDYNFSSWNGGNRTVSNVVRPVFYLKSNTYISDTPGTGTYASPFRIS